MKKIKLNQKDCTVLALKYLEDEICEYINKNFKEIKKRRPMLEIVYVGCKYYCKIYELEFMSYMYFIIRDVLYIIENFEREGYKFSFIKKQFIDIKEFNNETIKTLFEECIRNRFKKAFDKKFMEVLKYIAIRFIGYKYYFKKFSLYIEKDRYNFIKIFSSLKDYYVFNNLNLSECNIFPLKIREMIENADSDKEVDIIINHLRGICGNGLNMKYKNHDLNINYLK